MHRVHGRDLGVASRGRAPMPPMNGIGDQQAEKRKARHRLHYVLQTQAPVSQALDAAVSKCRAATPIKNRRTGRQQHKQDVLARERKQLEPVVFKKSRKLTLLRSRDMPLRAEYQTKRNCPAPHSKRSCLCPLAQFGSRAALPRAGRV